MFVLFVRLPVCPFGDEHVFGKNSRCNPDAIWGVGSNEPRYHVLDGGAASSRERGKFWGEMGQCNVTYRDNAASAVQLVLKLL